ncbi:MAG TPA: hypothetical protein ENH72_12025 [Pseudomonas sabulinigri]|uniref:Photosynthesis system II assembly factor Ycf48/Hcf136-like domain-containing protein n=1 Tax=marine sediment metagenome TaxID=412755 RepID=A0A0F9VJA4_9ZZZZ|nr:hypothetical protein [Halopseudomonas sabulinigri]HEC50917.1 hypothetical protein [Halopseudomonas sabulinigri]
MRKPINWRAPFMVRANAFQTTSKQNFPIRSVLSTLALSAAVAGFAMPGVSLAEAAEDIKPAVESELSASDLLLDAALVGERLVAVGSRGHIVYSDDQGSSWKQAAVPVRQLLTAVYFADDKNGWAVGHDSLILHTTDGGANWAMQYRDPELDEALDPEGPSLLERPLMDVWFRDAKTGFAVGAYGIFLRTDDGGENWQDVSDVVDNPDGFHYNSIAEIKGAGLFLVGEMGTMYRSVDYGDTWETLTDMPYDGSWFGVSGTNQENLVLVWGLRGNMYRSTDFGDSWQQVALKTQSNNKLGATLLGGSVSEAGELAVVGAGGVVVISHDGGKTFNVSTRPDRVALASAKVLKNGQILLVGQNGVSIAAASGLKVN